MIIEIFEAVPLWLRVQLDSEPYWCAKGVLSDDAYAKVGPLQADPSGLKTQERKKVTFSATPKKIPAKAVIQKEMLPKALN